MLPVLFVIIKILAIILASILGLLLFLVLIVLFVPIRYCADLKKKDELVVKARIHWLLRIIFVRVWFVNQQLHLKFRVFGICFYDNLRPKKNKNVKAEKLKKDKKVRKEIKVKEVKIDHNNDSDEIKLDKVDQANDEIVGKKEILIESKYESENEVKTENSVIHERGIPDAKPETVILEEKLISKKSKGIFQKILALFRKLIKLGDSIKGFFRTLKAKISGFRNIIKKLWYKKTLVMDFLKDDINKSGLKVLIKRIWEVLKRCAPKKVSGYLRYGTGDPCSTGEAFAAAAVFYSKYGNSLIIEPDFEEKILDAEVTIKGRIRIFSLLIIGIRLIRDKNFKKLLKNAKQLKEEL